jgi:DNA repair protein RadC
MAAIGTDRVLMQQQILRFGAERLTDAEILTVLLGVRRAGGTALAEQLLARVGNLQNLLASSTAELCTVPGLGQARAARLRAATELGRRHLGGPVDRRRSMARPSDAAAFLRSRLAELAYEVFGCLFLDTRHRLICFEPLFRGTLDGATVYPREVLKRALHHNAAALILGHNHPSGDCEPSQADRSITERLARALALVDIRLLDHVVVSSAGHVSLAERGWI